MQYSATTLSFHVQVFFKSLYSSSVNPIANSQSKYKVTNFTVYFRDEVCKNDAHARATIVIGEWGHPFCLEACVGGYPPINLTFAAMETG